MKIIILLFFIFAASLSILFATVGMNLPDKTFNEIHNLLILCV